MAERLAIKRVQQRMACAVGGGGAAISLTTFAEFQGLSTEGALVDFAFLRSGEGDAVVLEL